MCNQLSFCLSLEYSMTVKLLTEHHLEFLSLKGGCTGSSESTFVNMPHCWKSHLICFQLFYHAPMVNKLSKLYHELRMEVTGCPSPTADVPLSVTKLTKVSLLQ